jgi:hypothetical protein
MRLIDADNVLELFRAEYQNTKNLIKQGEKHLDSLAEGYTEAAHIIKHISPTVDAVPVVHGRWKLLHKGGWTSVFVCSVCGRRETITESESYNSQHKMPKEYPYCHCGARMDGDSDAEEN